MRRGGTWAGGCPAGGAGGARRRLDRRVLRVGAAVARGDGGSGADRRRGPPPRRGAPRGRRPGRGCSGRVRPGRGDGRVASRVHAQGRAVPYDGRAAGGGDARARVPGHVAPGRTARVRLLRDRGDVPRLGRHAHAIPSAHGFGRVVGGPRPPAHQRRWSVPEARVPGGPPRPPAGAGGGGPPPDLAPPAAPADPPPFPPPARPPPPVPARAPPP